LHERAKRRIIFSSTNLSPLQSLLNRIKPSSNGSSVFNCSSSDDNKQDSFQPPLTMHPALPTNNSRILPPSTNNTVAEGLHLNKDDLLPDIGLNGDVPSPIVNHPPILRILE
jgi:hypothetical protein